MEDNDESSCSEKTIIVEDEELDNILKKYSSTEHKSSEPPYKETNKNIYNLDEFSDEEFKYEPLENRIKQPNSNERPPGGNSPWHRHFSADDFCEDSNDLDAVLNRISQLENEQFLNEPRPTASKEINGLISGHIIDLPATKNKSSDNDVITLGSDSSDEGFNGFALDNELEKIKQLIKSDIKLSEEKLVGGENSSPNLSSDNVTAEPRLKKQKKTIDKSAEKLEKELAKAIKAKEREQKKLEKENQKQLKDALKVVESCIKPDQCIQYLTVNIDENIAGKYYGDVVKVGLASGGYNYTVSKQIVPNLISWRRRVPTIVDNGVLKDIYQQEKHYMLIMDVPEFIQHVVDNTLTGKIQSMLSMSQIGHLSIAILGLQKYYKFLRNDKNQEFKAAVTGTGSRKTDHIEFQRLPKVDRKSIERKLVELQIFCKNIYIRPVEKLEDLAVFIGECTKSVAQIPYKAAKAESLQQENEFFTVDNRDCVKVDKDGNGLNRLWNQFLRMFPLASLETAEAVTSVYPTMHSLIEAYQNTDKVEEGEKLLQDLLVRRAAGPLGGQRRLGPEFSKKAYRFFCSKDNVLL